MHAKSIRSGRTGACLFATAVCALLLQACGNSDEASTTRSPANEPSLPLPAELDFKKIEQEFQQQQQQFGDDCPKNFKAEFFPSGDVIISDSSNGQEVIKGKMTQEDFALVATLANDVVQQGPQDQTQVECKQVDDETQQTTTTQMSITDKEDKTDMVFEKRTDETCDFSKSGKGEQLQQQVNQVVQKGCNNQLPPASSPSPSPTASPSPSPTASPSPSPTASPSPSPSPSASPSPSPTGSPTAAL